jgi:DNA-binding phage protein
VKARSDRLRLLHANPAWHAAAVARIHPANQDAATKARTVAAATAGRRAMLADPVRRARLVAACCQGQRRRLAQPAERAKHQIVMRKVHKQTDWRRKVIAGVRAARARPGWQQAFERGMARRDADGLHGARVREGLRRKRRNDPVFAAEASERGRAAMTHLHADPKTKAYHRTRMAALNKDPDFDAWRRARQQWYFACQRAAKSGLPPPPSPIHEGLHHVPRQEVPSDLFSSTSTNGAKRMNSRSPLRQYSATAAKQPGQRSLAQLVKFHKKRLRATYRQLAKATGLSVATLWELVHSAQVKPTLETMHRIAYVLGFSLADVAPPL